MVPFQPIIEDGQAAFAMLEDLQRKHDWVFKTLRYSSLERLIETMDKEIVEPAEAKFRQLLVRRAEPIEDRRAVRVCGRPRAWATIRSALEMK